MKDLIFEIGCEELPSGYIDPALEWLADNAAKELTAQRLAFGAVKCLGTPRRLVLVVRAVADAQSDLTSEVLGPRAEQAWGADGALTPQALGFLGAKKIDASLAYKKATPKGEVLAAKVFEKGQSANAVLAEILPRLMRTMPFTKVLKWESSGATFARPVRWILAILGAETVHFNFADVTSGAKTTGHRFMSPEWVTVASVENYFELMPKKSVMLDGAQRRAAIAKSAADLAHANGGELVVDEALLNIVKNLVEYPWPLVGKFESRYLQIPREILISEMREHQKYFAVQDKHGALLPCFVVVAGSKPSNEQDVADGNARVLRARFEDGSFYYYDDLKQSLSSFVSKLERVQFQRELGSVAEKALRVEALAMRLAEQLSSSAEVKAQAARAAQLCKADLVSGVVAQFPELQGVMGSYYAANAGEPAEVVLAIREHYWPRFAGDALSSSEAGCLVSLADKMDTLVGVIGVGKAPKGNADPFALRRLGISITRIITERGMRLSLAKVVGASLSTYDAKLKPSAALQEEIVAFILGRAKGVFESATVIVDGAMAAGSDDMADLAARIAALNYMQRKNPEEFAQLAAALKRAGNIVAKAIADKLFDSAMRLDGTLLEAASEKQLLSELDKMQANLKKIGASGSQADLQKRYVEVMQEIAALKPYVDKFFDDVMVMCENVALRNARLALLNRLQSAASVIADFTRVQV